MDKKTCLEKCKTTTTLNHKPARLKQYCGMLWRLEIYFLPRNGAKVRIWFYTTGRSGYEYLKKRQHMLGAESAFWNQKAQHQMTNLHYDWGWKNYKNMQVVKIHHFFRPLNWGLLKIVGNPQVTIA